MKYFDEIKKSMEYLAKKKNTIFLGQAVSVSGTAMFNTLKDIDIKKKIELPVAEEMQMGMSLGMALEGYLPVTIYPRWNFLLLATNQLVNHLDKISEISNNQINPQIIIRTAVGSVRPLDPQSQHRGDFSNAFKQMCKNIDIYKITKPSEVFKTYKKALLNKKRISLVVEIADFYNEK
jgi:pyruvate/2-oxoglutarate/acetoin dehydrogenase E1 component